MQECTDFSKTKINQNGNITFWKHDYKAIQPNTDFRHSPASIQTKRKLSLHPQCHTNVTAVTDTDSAMQSTQNGSSLSTWHHKRLLISEVTRIKPLALHDMCEVLIYAQCSICISKWWPFLCSPSRGVFPATTKLSNHNMSKN